jgi:hypothetical protein
VPAEVSQSLEVAPRRPGKVLPVEAESEALLVHDFLEPNPSELSGQCDEGDVPDASFANLSDCRTGSCASPPGEGFQPESPLAGPRGPTDRASRGEGGPRHGSRGQLPPTAEQEGCAPHAPALPTSQDLPPHERLRPFAFFGR